VVTDAVAHVQDLDLRARRLELAVQGGTYAWTTGALDLSRAALDLHEAALIVVHDSRASLRVEAPSVVLRSARMHVDQAGSAGGVSVDVTRAETHDLRPVGLLLRLPKNLTIDGGRASLSLRADVDLHARTVAADGELIARDLAVHAGSRSLNGMLKIALHARRRGTTTALSGSTVAFDSTDAADPSASWWARADLVDGELSSGGLHFRGKVHLTAKDASPLVAMVGADTAVPLWIAKDVPMHGLAADTELRLSPNRSRRVAAATSSSSSMPTRKQRHLRPSGRCSSRPVRFTLRFAEATWEPSSCCSARGPGSTAWRRACGRASPRPGER
jgi:hypothetical protein